MARFPGAFWRPVTGHTDGPMRSHTGVVLHVNQSNGNLYNWVAGDHNMSCHFEVYKDGLIEQYLDTDVSGWAQMDGNADYLSIETEGFDTEPLTPKQCAAIARILAWTSTVHGIPLRLADKPGEPGFGWHGMGGAAWGGHTGCPGQLRKNQRPAILGAAALLLHAPDPTPSPTPEAGMRFKVYGNKDVHGAAVATAPGTWRPITIAEFGALTAIGECDGKVHMVSGATFTTLKRVITGG